MVFVTKGDLIWIEPTQGQGDTMPIGARVIDQDHGRLKVVDLDDSGNEQWLSAERKIRLMHPTSVQGVQDLCQLGDYHQSAILRNLIIRYRERLIYTYVGSILLAVNPYMDLPIYKAEQIRMYKSKKIGELPPHIFALGDNCFTNMRKTGQNQSIVISGESGAGKTESTKILLQFLATISGQHSWIEQQVLEANPILEAFGNAKTIRNDNSSRFGKYIEVHFNNLGSIEGARIENYLLEKSRIIAQQENERNYHIFYCLLAGLSAEERRDLELTAASDFFYLIQGKTLAAGGRDDAADLAEIRSALKVLMFKEHEIWNIFKVLAAILHIGNVKFKANIIDNMESVNVCDAENILRIARLLQLREQDVIDSLTTRTMNTRDERLVTRLAAAQAIDARDSLAKAIYSRLFSYILSRINDSIYKPSSNGSKRTSIGILDIFGFENFENNSFEQLCINYANEHLQQFFVQHIFKMEQKEYDEEEINWKHIRFTDNQVTLDLIADKPMSIMSLIDEESIFPKGTDKTMLQKLNANHGKHEFYLKPKSDLQKLFGVNHYAGVVHYASNGFLEKNRDTLSSDLVGLMLSSKTPFLVRLFDDVCYDNSQRKKGSTVSMQFRRSLEMLMLQLSQTVPFFIRCIKPNDYKRALVIDSELVIRQLRYSGMLDTIRIRRCGYPVRHHYAGFVARYRILLNGIGPAHKIDCYAATETICRKALGDNTDFQLGKTKVFLKEKDDLKLEQEYYRRLHERATTIQKQVRCWLQRKQFVKKRQAAIVIQKTWRGFLAKRRYQQILNGISRLQAILRTRRLMLHYQTLRTLIINFQAHCKGCLVRRELVEMRLKGEKKAPSPVLEESVKVEEVKEDELVGQLFDFLPSDRDSVEDESPSLRSLPSTQFIETPSSEDYSKYQFGKFAATFFLGQATPSHVKKPLVTALLAHNDQRNQKAALAVWVTILRFMGDLPDVKQSTNVEANDKTAVMNRLYSTLGRNYSWRQEEEATNTKTMRKGMGKLISMTLRRKSGGSSDVTLSEASDSSCSSLNSLLEGKQMSSLEKLHMIIGMGILREDLRDEIYCQLCKQLTENPSKLSAARGWILLSLCVGCFAPSDKFINYLYCFIRERGPSGTGYAAYIEQRLRRTQRNGTRHQPPSYVELQANKSKKPVLLAITLMDGSVKTVSADSASTSREVCAMLAEKVGLTDYFGFSLYIALFDKVSSLGSGGDHVMDAISQCEQYAKELGKQERNAPWRLFFRKEIFVPWHDSKIDAVSTNLIYQQIIRGIKYGEYRCDKEEDLASLVAQQHYIDGGTLQVEKLESSIALYLPEFELNGKQQLAQEKWVQAVMHQYRKKFTGRQPSPLEVKEDVVSFAKFKWPLLFSRFYEALKFAGPPLPKNEIIIAVNWTGVYVVNDREQVLLEFTYPHISSVRFCRGKRRGTDTVAIGTVSGEEYTFQSPNADDVVQLVNEFIDGLKKRSKYLLATKAQGVDENESYLQFDKGDLLILIDGYNGASLLKESVVKGENSRTCSIGLIKAENVYVLPSLIKPSRTVLEMFPKDIDVHADTLNNNNKIVIMDRGDVEPHTLRAFAENNFREAGKRVSLMTLRKREGQSEKWKFSREPLDQPLLKKLEGRDDACKAATDSYLCVLKYMGDIPTKRSRLGTELTDRIFKPAIHMEVLRDELYCQLMKQLTSNPSLLSEERGWELMWLSTGLFAPSSSLLKEVSLFLKSRPHPIALDCHNRMQKLAKGGSRKYPPHLVEVEAIQHKTTQIFHRVFFPDHSDEAIEVDSATKAKDFALRITQRLHIKNSSGFSLFVKIKEKVLAVPENDFFFDFVRQLSDWVQTNYAQKESPIVPVNYQVFFMRKLWNNVVPGEDPRADLIFHYYQECPKYLLGYHKTTKQDVILLAALILRAITKDNKNAPLAQIPQLLNDLLPKNMAKLHTPAEWKKLISSAYVPVEHLTSDQAKIDFLQHISQWPTFGSAFFPVSQYSDLSLPDRLLIAINQNGVHLYHSETKALLIQYSFNVICNWTSGNTYFNLTVGNMIRGSEGKKLLLDTTMGYKMDDLLSSYMSQLLAKQAVPQQRNSHQT